MGKTTQHQSQATPRSDGEIALLADEGVGNISDYDNFVAAETKAPLFGDLEDDHAIGNVINHLRRVRQSANSGATDEDKLQDLAIDLYNNICDRIRAGRMSWPQIEHAAGIFGEDPEKLANRLIDSGDRI